MMCLIILIDMWFFFSDVTLGGEDEEAPPEDEMDRLLRENVSQTQEEPLNTPRVGEAGNPSNLVRSLAPSSGSEGSSTSDVLFNRAMIAITAMANTNARAGESTEDLKKVITMLSDTQKRKRDEQLEEEEFALMDEMVHIRDDSNNIIDMGIRQRLRNPNSCPSEWWVSSVMEKRCHPIIGQNMYLAHLMPGRINPLTIRKIHDRSLLVTPKALSSSNSGCTGEKKMIYKLHQSTDDDDTMLMGGRSYVDCKTVYEVVESIFNYMAVCHQVRPYSYEMLSLLRGLHHIKYYYGVTDDAKLQKQLVERLVSEVFSYNQRRGLEKKFPATFKKVIELAKVSVLYSVYNRCNSNRVALTQIVVVRGKQWDCCEACWNNHGLREYSSNETVYGFWSVFITCWINLDWDGWGYG